VDNFYKKRTPVTGHLPGLDVKAGRSLCGGLSAILILVLAALFLLGSSLPSASADTVKDVQLVYFYPRIRCVSCENVEAYAAEAAASYTGNGKEGIPFTQLAIDDPANSELVERYGVVGSSLYLVVGSIEDGEFEELKKVWFLWEDRDGCISYIQEEIDTAFTEGAASGDTGIPLESIPLLAAFLLGLLTAISPCPLATNIAAVAYIAKDIEDRKRAALSGVLYTAGRVAAYSALGLALVYLGANVVDISGFLRNSAVYYLGPLLILISLVMLDVINLNFLKGGYAARLGERVSGKGPLGAFLLGGIFALSFCPYSAILFFGMLIPLAIETTAGGLYLPAVYAVGTGLPVLIVALAIAFGAGAWAGHVDRVQKWEKYIRKGAGVVFLGIGIYYLVLLVQELV
jgi:cytochrome c-type biogenesis protein